MAQVKEPLAVQFEKAYYICDHCRTDLLPGWRGNICHICQGNFCSAADCIETITIPGQGKQFVCHYCREVAEKPLATLARLELERQGAFKYWQVQTESPAMKKENKQ